MTQSNSTAAQPPFLSPWWMLYALLVLGFPIYFLVNIFPTPDDYGHVPPFSLQDQEDQTINIMKIDRPMIVNFIFTRCQNVCPILTAKMATLQERLDSDEAILLSISVDPNHDSPSVLKEFAEQFHANSEQWHFLTGEETRVLEIIRSFQQAYDRQGGTEDAPNILHSEKFVLLDKDAHIRGFFDDDPKGLNTLLRTISAL